VRNNSVNLYLELSDKDINSLINFKKAIKYTGDIRCRAKQSTYGLHKSCILEINSAHTIYEDLLLIWNITQNKSLTLVPPNIYDKNHILPYIIGYIDGDGSIFIRNIDNRPNLVLSIAG